MPSRRGARVAELQHPLMPLVLLEGDFAKAFVGRILSSLPLDERLRAREVSRGWRFFLEDASFWARVDLSARCGVNPRRLSSTHRTLALLRAACVRAQGNLLAVDLSGVSLCEEEEQEAAAREWEREREIERRARDQRRRERSSQRYKTKVTLQEEEEEEEEEVEEEEEEEDEVAVVPPFVLKWAQALSVADKASLRDLVAPTYCRLDAAEIRALCRTLPLCRLSCCVDCSEAPTEALPLLRREPPFALLTIGELSVHSVEGEGPPQSVLDLASALTGHTGMERLTISNMRLAPRAEVDALVEAAISAGINYAHFGGCGLSQNALPALGRLLQSPGFERLIITNDDDDYNMFKGPALPSCCDALRSSMSLKTLKLCGVMYWADTEAASQLIAALEGLPALHELSLAFNRTDGTPAVQRTAGECLARLIARSTSLRVLDLCDTILGEAGMTPIFQALGGSRTLVELSLYEGIGSEFARNFVSDVVLPAVRACTSLRMLTGLANARDFRADLEGIVRTPTLKVVEDILVDRRWR